MEFLAWALGFFLLFGGTLAGLDWLTRAFDGYGDQ